MEISGSSAVVVDSAVQVAIQKQALDAMKVQGAQLNQLIASASPRAGSVNSPSQGHFVDAQV